MIHASACTLEKTSTTLEDYLEDLEAQIDDAQEKGHRAAWRAFLDNEIREGFFIAPDRRPRAPRLNWPKININDVIEDVDLMLLREFGAVSNALATGSRDCLSVRSNYGTGILPTLFGCKLFIMPRETDTLPTTHPCESLDQLRALVERGVPDLNGGLGARVFECAERIQDILERHPVLKRNIALYHPDLQGPIDLCELIWGSGIFIGIYDEPELLRQLLQLVTETYMRFMEKWLRLVPSESEYSVHWSFMHKGRLMIRNDSLTNLSPDVYVDLIRPFDQQLLTRFGGGAIHFCGHGDHFIAAMSQMRVLNAVHMSQPHLNNVDKILEHTAGTGIKLLGLEGSAADKTKHPPHGQVHVLR